MSVSRAPASRTAIRARSASPSRPAASTPRETIGELVAAEPRHDVLAAGRRAEGYGGRRSARGHRPDGRTCVLASLNPSRSTSTRPTGSWARPPAVGALEQVDQRAAVGEPGERVGQRQPAGLLAQLHEPLLADDDQRRRAAGRWARGSQLGDEPLADGVGVVEERQRVHQRCTRTGRGRPRGGGRSRRSSRR